MTEADLSVSAEPVGEAAGAAAGVSASAGEAQDDERPSWAPGALLAGKYTLLRPLGVGGMGVVWCARNESTGADVAIKMVLPRSLADRDELAARFRREAMATARLRHRSIVVVYDLVEVPEEGMCSLALVMELLEGETLAKLLERRGFLAPHEAVEIGCALLGALAHAHAAGIVHRDIKPENVFLATDGDGQVTPKVLDFGISKLDIPKAGLITREGELLGTPSYMSPEQARSAEIDGRSDLFNVGILLYEMLTGFNPFAGEGLHEVIVAILEHDPAPLASHGVSLKLAAVVERALQKEVGKRFANAREMMAALREASGDGRQTSSPQLHVNTLQHLSTIPAPAPDAQLFTLTPPNHPPAGFAPGGADPRGALPEQPMRASMVSATIPPTAVATGDTTGVGRSLSPSQWQWQWSYFRRRRTGVVLLAGTAVLAACALGFSSPRRGNGTIATFGQTAAADESTTAPGISHTTSATVPAAPPVVPPALDNGDRPDPSGAIAQDSVAALDTGGAVEPVAARHAESASKSSTDAGSRRAFVRGGLVRDPGF